MELFLVCLVVLMVAMLGWVFYMMTCRTDDWVKLVKADEDMRDRRAQRAGKIVNGVAEAATKYLKQ